MSKAEKFEDLEAWKLAREQAREVFALKKRIIADREFGLYDQISRSSTSVMHNIAEGFESESDKGFISYLYIAKSSAGEVRSQLHEAVDKGILTTDSAMFGKSRRVSAKIQYLIQSIRKSGFRGTRYK
jgi:four helix bundle protein